jgi:hypothetical protein
MFELEVLVLELRAVDTERAGAVVPLEVSSLDHELWDANGVSGGVLNGLALRQRDKSTTRLLDDLDDWTNRLHISRT